LVAALVVAFEFRMSIWRVHTENP